MDESPHAPSQQNFQVVAQRFLDRSVPFVVTRYLVLVFLALQYCLRVYYIQGFYVVTYALGIYLLKLLVLFVQPLVDPESEDDDQGPGLPSLAGDEYKPFVRKMPEFKVWLSAVKAIVVCLFMTFLPFLDIPVYWPILLVYFVLLFVLTAKKQIMHMWNNKYVPFNVGKKRYDGKPSNVREYEK
eukprot:TRINITY_DN8527_c0_g1_i1.p1 TRINITY_DN8527_c0_g1~~TRINITY_DN8527_c0_g1_i1.p1  ORF type:complete len:184 (+),score=48.52 TRINITY_DN8527_c0_g1_i1:85-636(+)